MKVLKRLYKRATWGWAVEIEVEETTIELEISRRDEESICVFEKSVQSLDVLQESND